MQRFSNVSAGTSCKGQTSSRSSRRAPQPVHDQVRMQVLQPRRPTLTAAWRRNRCSGSQEAGIAVAADPAAVACRRQAGTPHLVEVEDEVQLTHIAKVLVQDLRRGGAVKWLHTRLACTGRLLGQPVQPILCAFSSCSPLRHAAAQKWQQSAGCSANSLATAVPPQTGG